MMNSYAECGLRIDGTTLGTNDKGELSVIGGSGGNDKPRQISLYDEQGNVATQLTIEAEGGKETSKGLSEEDFTVELKAKLEGIVELPVVTETDNGKVLKVVNSVWAVADA